MSKLSIIIVCALIFVGTAFASVVLHGVELVDIKSNGTATGYFARPQVKYWNFAGTGGNATIASGTMTIGQHYAPYDPDMGSTESKELQIGSTVAKGTCAAALRGVVYTVQDAAADGGTKDITYQCCKLGASTYNWVSPTCL